MQESDPVVCIRNAAGWQAQFSTPDGGVMQCFMDEKDKFENSMTAILSDFAARKIEIIREAPSRSIRSIRYRQ